LEVCAIRGNVDTRLRRIEEGEIAGLILAAAGLKRLGWAEKISEYLPLEHFLPTAGQGALAIELRSDDKEVIEIVSALNHLPTWQSITAERAFLHSLGGGCQAPIAALGRVNGASLNLEGMVADGSGGKIIHTSIEGSVTSPEEVGVRLARNVLKMGAAEFL
jgi:hydroxymethylbilane synthase